MGCKQILIIEDDAAIREGIEDALECKGYETISSGCGIDGGEKALMFSYDLLLLDLHLPGRDGLDILVDLRTARPSMPVIIITARGAEDERVNGLKLGADDYIVKPFNVNELLARIEAVLRRSPERPADIKDFIISGIKVNLDRRLVCFTDGSEEQLSEREASLLRYLALNRGRTVSREAILSRVWRIDASNLDTRTVDMHIARLREKLGDNKKNPEIIRTVRGKGYVLE